MLDAAESVCAPPLPNSSVAPLATVYTPLDVPPPLSWNVPVCAATVPLSSTASASATGLVLVVRRSVPYTATRLAEPPWL